MGEPTPDVEVEGIRPKEGRSDAVEPITSDAGADDLTITTTEKDSAPATAEPSNTIPVVTDIAAPATAATAAAVSASPAPRRPKPPTKGILKPPPPPGKPTLSNRLRDIAGVAKSLFDPLEEPLPSPSGPSSASPSTQAGVGSGRSTNGHDSYDVPSVSSAFSAFSGRLGAGFNRLVVAASQVPTQSQSSPGVNGNGGTPQGQGSPMGIRSISLPDVVSPLGLMGGTEKSKQNQPLKRATFVLPSLSITYPISSQGEPWSLKVVEDRDRIESSHRSLLSSSTGAGYWTNERLVILYENACRGREERARGGIVRSLELLPPPPRPRHIHIVLRPPERPSPPSQPSPLSIDTPLNRHAAEALADIMNIEWGLSDLRLENGALETEEALKPLLHALLMSGTLPSLSLAGNKRIKAGGWRLLAVFMKRARSLRYIDLSDTTWDRKGVEYLVQALNWTTITPPSAGVPVSSSEAVKAEEVETVAEKDKEVDGRRDCYGSFGRHAPYLKEAEAFDAPSAVQTLRMDGCALRANVLEALATGIRSSDIKNLSLRRNRIGPLGGVALALMIRDYPDSNISMATLSPALQAQATNLNHSSPGPSHLSLDSNSTSTYTPRRRTHPPPIPDHTADSNDPSLPPIPKVTSSAAGGITSRTLPEGYRPSPSNTPTKASSTSVLGLEGGVNVTPIEGRMATSTSEFGGASMALQRSVRALDGVERIGRLLTLDLKGNEIKNGVAYIAQVLKRNRTLKVLNLSDNKIEVPGLTALAEALKYNSCLETLDVSSNPCSGPNLEGVSALRTTFTVNTSLKRLFLSDTGLTTDGAISLAEFLPETKSLLHLDLTSNPLIETAGILALSVGLKSNTLIRCLDLSIPPNSPDLAELSQSILQSCIRNTELAADTAKPGPGQDAVWQPIKKSALVKDVKAADRLRQDKERTEIANSSEGQARKFVYTLKPENLVPQAEELVEGLNKWFEAGKAYKRPGFVVWQPGQLPMEEYEVLYERAKVLRERIVDRIQEDQGPEELDRLLGINDVLAGILEKGGKYTPPPRLLLPSQIVNADTSSHATRPTVHHRQSSNSNSHSLARGAPSQNGPGSGTTTPTGLPRSVRRHMRIPSLEISSPNFSIGDSDNDSDAEELDVGSFSRSPAKPTTKGVIGLGMEEDAELLGVTANQDSETAHSPVERASRAWVEEEGEIFRKGTKLGVAEEDEVEEKEEVSGEELKKEILDIHVERSPTRRVVENGNGTEGEKIEANDVAPL